MVKERENLHSPDDKSLMGTFTSVMLLGGFLIVSWLGVFIIYLLRG